MVSGSPGRRRAEAVLCRAAKAEGFALPFETVATLGGL